MAGLMDALSIASTGLQAAGAQLSVTANNIANADTPNYKPRRADLVELSGGGVGVGSISEKSGEVDLPTEMVNLIKEKSLYNANAAVVKTADRMLGSVLDLFDQDRGGNSK